MQADIEQVAEHLAHAEFVVVSTGAGVSRESGVPTFREAQTGLWAQYDPTQLATPQAFARNPGQVWDFYTYRRELVQQTQPNPGHYALAELETLLERFLLVTQNVDNHHHKAGSQNVITLHGDLFSFKCSCPEARTIYLDGLTDESRAESPPPCPFCDSGYTRPDVVWFGEQLPEVNIKRAFGAALTCDVMLVVGTSGMVYPAARLPIDAKRHGAFVVEVNPEASELTSTVDVHLAGPSGEVLPALVTALKAKLGT